MSKLTIYTDNHSDSTSISNRFIDNYMKDANDAQLKIYLYLVRLMNDNRSTTVTDMADKFNHTEKDVLRALKYWEKNHLLSLDFDNAKSLVGIHLQDLDQVTVQDTAKKNTEVTITPVVHEFVKPSYSLDQLKEFRNNAETGQLFFIAESYIRKPLTSNDMKTLLFIYERLGFSIDLIDHLIQYCVDRSKKDFRYIEKVAICWAEDGITTVEQARERANKYDKNVYSVMKALGKNTVPVDTEVAYITKWTHEYAFTMDIIMEACDRTVLATDRHRFEYADSILNSWYKEGIHHKSDIKLLDSKYQKQKTTTMVNKASGNNKFNQFQQNSYDFDTLEQEILSN